MQKTKLALFASGTGSNVYNIIDYFSKNESIEVFLVLSNKPNAGALLHAKNASIATFVFDKNQLEDQSVCNFLLNNSIDYVILAGFLLKIPEHFINAFRSKIINIHPSLLPLYGGKGMYGHFVHEAVFNNNETVTGITIHLVNEHYDDGQIIAQFDVALNVDDTPETIASKISVLEKLHFPKTIEHYISLNR